MHLSRANVLQLLNYRKGYGGGDTPRRGLTILAISGDTKGQEPSQKGKEVLTASQDKTGAAIQRGSRRHLHPGPPTGYLVLNDVPGIDLSLQLDHVTESSSWDLMPLASPL